MLLENLSDSALELNLKRKMDIAVAIQNLLHLLIRWPVSIAQQRHKFSVVAFDNVTFSATVGIQDPDDARVVLISLKPRVQVAFHKGSVAGRPIHLGPQITQRVER